jgi:hypothetical protein
MRLLAVGIVVFANIGCCGFSVWGGWACQAEGTVLRTWSDPPSTDTHTASGNGYDDTSYWKAKKSAVESCKKDVSSIHCGKGCQRTMQSECEVTSCNETPPRLF